MSVICVVCGVRGLVFDGRRKREREAEGGRMSAGGKVWWSVV